MKKCFFIYDEKVLGAKAKVLGESIVKHDARARRGRQRSCHRLQRFDMVAQPHKP